MQSTVDSTIANLRGVVGAKTDAELGRMLGIDQSTISSWRARGRVPGRFTKMLDGVDKSEAFGAPQVWGELQERAQAVALIRFTLLRAAIAQSQDVDRAMSTFLDLKPFWLVLHRAGHDLRLKMESLGVDLRTAQALIMQDDLREPQSTSERVEAQVAEDITDNPWLSSWK